MTKDEFTARINQEVTDDEFKEIEFVYNWHPSISETKGKSQIAYLYTTFGIRIIKDMIATAMRAKELENEMLKTKNKLEELKKEYKKLKE